MSNDPIPSAAEENGLECPRGRFRCWYDEPVVAGAGMAPTLDLRDVAAVAGGAVGATATGTAAVVGVAAGGATVPVAVVGVGVEEGGGAPPRDGLG